MTQLIEVHRDDHGVEAIFRVPPITPTTFYDNMAKQADPSRLSDRAKRDEQLKPEIERVFEENLKVYGVRKIWHQMHREGFHIARCTGGPPDERHWYRRRHSRQEAQNDFAG